MCWRGGGVARGRRYAGGGGGELAICNLPVGDTFRQDGSRELSSAAYWTTAAGFSPPRGLCGTRKKEKRRERGAGVASTQRATSSLRDALSRRLDVAGGEADQSGAAPSGGQAAPPRALAAVRGGCGVAASWGSRPGGALQGRYHAEMSPGGRFVVAWLLTAAFDTYTEYYSGYCGRERGIVESKRGPDRGPALLILVGERATAGTIGSVRSEWRQRARCRLRFLGVASSASPRPPAASSLRRSRRLHRRGAPSAPAPSQAAHGEGGGGPCRRRRMLRMPGAGWLGHGRSDACSVCSRTIYNNQTMAPPVLVSNFQKQSCEPSQWGSGCRRSLRNRTATAHTHTHIRGW